MRSRRQFFQLSLAVLLASAARAAWLRADPQPPAELSPPQSPTPSPLTAVEQPVIELVWVPLASAHTPPISARQARAEPSSSEQVWLPLAQSSQQPSPTPLAPTSVPITIPNIDAPLLGRSSGTSDQAIAWLAARAVGYTPSDITSIVGAYRDYGESIGMDWFLALAQLAHETGSLSSWWSQRPRRNPAGIGVTGTSRPGLPDGTPGPAPGSAWAWSDTWKKWLQGVSFATWVPDAVPAHLGRLLAYALPPGGGNAAQQQMIVQALGYRSMPASHRGTAPMITGLNGRWAVPGTIYGQRIIQLAGHMREG